MAISVSFAILSSVCKAIHDHNSLLKRCINFYFYKFYTWNRSHIMQYLICLIEAPGAMTGLNLIPLRFWAFQWWFWIANRSIIKEIKPILVSHDSIGSLKLRGAPLLGEAPIIGRIRYKLFFQKSIWFSRFPRFDTVLHTTKNYWAACIPVSDGLV